MLHAAGKIHRDVKPSNIMVTATGRLVLLDFGLVTETAADPQSATGCPVGTARYMAPEQAASRPVGPEADLYSLGAVLYEALTGRAPFVGLAVEVMLAKQETAVTPPSALVEGIPPDLETLCLDLLRRVPGRRPTGLDVLTRLGASPRQAPARGSGRTSASFTRRVPFIGRQTELAQLGEAFQATRSHGPLTLLVSGESGVGKTALMRRFLELLRQEQRDLVVLEGRCYERESVPFKALDGVIDALSRHMTRLTDVEATALLPRNAALLAETFPVLRRVSAVARAPVTLKPSDLHPQEVRTHLFAGVRDLIGRLADRHPLVFAIDDLQWGDADGLALLAEILRPPEAPRLFLIAIQRLGVAGRELRLPGAVHHLDLGRLPHDDARRLAATLLSDARVGQVAASVDERAARIATEGEGHPLFIDEMVRHVATHGAEARLELRLDEALVARVSALHPDEQHLLRLLAVAGMPLPRSVVAAAVGLAVAALDRCVGALRVASLAQTSGARQSDHVACYHDRVREAVVSSLDEPTRAQLHRELAVALEGSGQAEAEVLALHWRAAGESDRAAAHTVRAAAQAEAALAFDHAAELYRIALELPGSDHEARDLRVRLGHVLAHAGRGREAAEAYLGAVAGAPPSERLELRRRAAEQYLRGGHIDEGLAVMREVLEAMGIHWPATPRRALLSLLWGRARVRLRGLSYEERDASEIAPEELARIDACAALGGTLGVIDTIRGAGFNAHLHLMALRCGEPSRLARALAYEIVHVSVGGRRSRPRVARLVAEARRVAARCAEPELTAATMSASGIADYQAGDFARALEQLQEAESLWGQRCVGARFELNTARLFHQFSLWYLGGLGELSRSVPRLLAEALDRGDQYLATTMQLSFLNAAWLVPDQVGEARRRAASALAGWSPQGSLVHQWFGPTASCQASLYAGDGGAAHATIARVWPRLRRSLILRIELVRLEALHLRARCALAAAAEPGADRQRLLLEATRDARRIMREKTHWATPLGHLIVAGVHAAQGRQDEAVQELTVALEGLEAAGLMAYAAAARRRLGELRGGDDGQALVDRAEAWFFSERVHAPRTWTAMLAPGFDLA